MSKIKSKFFTGTKEVEPVVEEEVSVIVEEVVEPVVEVEVKEVKELSLDGMAFSVAKNPTDKLYYVVKITFDIATGTVGKMEFVGKGVKERFVAVEGFKINVARNGLV